MGRIEVDEVSFWDDRDLTLLAYLLMRQVSGLVDCFRHLQRNQLFDSHNLDDMMGYKAYIESELSDVLDIVHKLCKLFSLDFEKVKLLGEQRTNEKKGEYLGRHPGSHWV